VWWIFLGVGACTGDDTPRRPAPATPATGSPSGLSADTGLGVGLYPDPPYDCSQGVVSGPFAATVVGNVEVTEAFTFDLDGYLVAAASNDTVVRYDSAGNVTPFSPALPSRGFGLLPDGDVVVADPDNARLVRLDATTGGPSDIGGVYIGVSGIDVDAEGVVYGSYLSPGRVTATDSTSGNTDLLGQPTVQTYGVALSPDEQRLYVAGYSPSDSTVYALDRTAEGWGAPQAVASFGNGLGGMATDVCGNLYVVQPNGCKLFRMAPDGTHEELADLGAVSFCASVAFGSGLGGWARDTLYMATYDEVRAFEVGVPGRPR